MSISFVKTEIAIFALVHMTATNSYKKAVSSVTVKTPAFKLEKQ